MHRALLAAILIGTCGMSLLAAAAPPQDGRTLTKLRWVAPAGELPGTYADYLATHPPTPARFAAPRDFPARAARDGGGAISLLVDAGLYPAIESALNGYIADLNAAGYAVHLQTITGGTPTGIKAWVQQRYAAGSEGVLFVGDILAAWAEVSGAVFPCDLFYMDLDGHWEDADADGDYDIHNAGSGDEGPEVYVARLYATTLDYDSEANMTAGYLAKTHAYRTGQLTQPWRGLEYIDKDWHDMDVGLDEVYDDDVIRHDFGHLTTAAGYLNEMDLGQHFVQVCAHSYSGGHHFSTFPTESASYAHAYIFSPTQRAVRLHFGSDDGIKAWLNGGLVLDRDVYQGWQPDQFQVAGTLQAGWNRLLCKISQGGGDYAFSARLTDAAGAPMPDVRYQINNPATHGEEAPFIRGWLLNGFHQDVSDNFWNYLTTNYLAANEAHLDPQAGDVTGGHTWTAVSAEGAFVDLNEYADDADFGATYAYVRVHSPEQVDCELWAGYDDGIRVWLNGAVVLMDNRYGDYAADMSQVPVTLNAGENRLLVKVSEWMGAYGFSVRFAHSDGSPVTGLSYDPGAEAIGYLGTWLMNGPYTNANQGTRLSTDYLYDGGTGTPEHAVSPSEADPAPAGPWHRGIGDAYPFDLGAHFDHGDWVYSADIQDRDPPVLFYNLFACGPGRFTDDNYLAGAYIFNTTYGLITVASAKSGSMLNFRDFTEPLGAGATVGQAFLAWFDAQAPFAQWEREWYYGMVLNGDPTLLVAAPPICAGDSNCDGSVNWRDIDWFVAAQNDNASAWAALFAPATPPCPFAVNDANGDGSVNWRDIDSFVALQNTTCP